ncbi:GNAT family N-acetyltransferase [Aquicoccus sp. SU-CL01552]|uniref:GNAT family N-acetyltransferase n=1 Tax=Aquicoccus sp. SU-CL01552 TaxID=3127656 RepID=UPI00310A2277
MEAPERLLPDDPRLAQVLALIRESFAYMDGRIDPPSSMHRLTLEGLSNQAGTAEVWALGHPVAACVVLTPRPDCLYLGKLAVDPRQRGTGLARRLVDLAVARARALGLPVLELQVRVELAENHAAFARLGFARTGETTHAGYDRPTSITMRRAVA